MNSLQRSVLLVASSMALAAWLAAATVGAATIYPHIANVSAIPGGQGNGTVFSGSVCWIGILGSGGCFPGYGNSQSQVAFRSFAIPSGSHLHLTYAYRVDSEPDSDRTYVIIDQSGTNPSLQPSGCHAFTSTRSMRDTVTIYSGGIEGTDDIDLTKYAGKTICVGFNSVSNASRSDEDCLYPSQDGLFEFKNVQVDTSLTTFDTGQNGWTFACLTYVDSVIVSIVGSGTVTRNPNLGVYELGSSVQLTATPSAGWHFVGWSGDASGNTNPLNVLVTGRKNITATFAINSNFTLSVSIVGHGSVLVNPNQTTYGSGTNVQITENPEPGWNFVAWSGDASGSSNPINVVMNSNKSITATFVPTHAGCEPKILRITTGDAFAFVLSLPSSGDVHFRVVDVAGRHVTTLVHGFLPKGTHTVMWNATGDAGRRLPGIYFAQLVAAGTVVSQKVVVGR